MVRTDKILRADKVVELFIISAFEGELSAEKCKQQDTKSPYISWWPGVFNLAYDFWGHIGGSPTENLHLPFMRNASREAKVDHLDNSLGFVQ